MVSKTIYGEVPSSAPFILFLLPIFCHASIFLYFLVCLKSALREAQSAVLGAVTQRAFGDRSGVDAVGQK